MILYINGDSHAAGAEAVTPHAWAEDDGDLWGHGRVPHPTNEAASFGAILSNLLKVERINQSQSGGSNPRILRTTREWIHTNPSMLDKVFMLIQWSTWEREEWFYDNIWWQVNASGVDTVPSALVQRYKEFVANVDWTIVTRRAHEEIWAFHHELTELGIPHLFFNANSHFGGTHLHNNLQVPIISEQRDWNKSYISPYSVDYTYNKVLLDNGFSRVNPESYHFGADAHCFWGKYLLQYIQSNQLWPTHEISANRFV